MTGTNLAISPRPDRAQLRSAKARTQGAAQRLLELERLEAQMRSLPNPIMLSADRAAWDRRESVKPTIRWDARHSGFAAEAAMLAGEILYHVRTGLDYLIYNLAWLDSGRPQKQTQFPIHDRKKEWPGACGSRLRWVNDAHRRVIRSHQPFAGCAWTATLRTLSNDDKHNFVVQLFREYEFRVQLSDDTVTVDPDDETRVLIAIDPPDVRFCAPDGSSLVPVLTEITRNAAVLIMSFQAEFGEADEIEFR